MDVSHFVEQIIRHIPVKRSSLHIPQSVTYSISLTNKYCQYKLLTTSIVTDTTARERILCVPFLLFCCNVLIVISGICNKSLNVFLSWFSGMQVSRFTAAFVILFRSSLSFPPVFPSYRIVFTSAFKLIQCLSFESVLLRPVYLKKKPF